MHSNETLRDAAAAIATAAGALIREAHLRGAHQFETKSAAIDLVTEVDRASERLIADALFEEFPSHGLLGEENATRDGSPLWIVDPLDGTTNFVHGIPTFAVSMAAVDEDGLVLAGVVYDVMREEMFAAARGAGAACNGETIRVSSRAKLAEAVACTGFPYDRREKADFYLKYWRAVMTHTQGVRRTGAAALDLAWVAAGRYDAFWEFGLAAWDVAAASLLIEEAAGTVTGIDGTPLDLHAKQIAATNGHLHPEFLDLLSLE